VHESPLTPWANFYVFVGSAAATLTGLMFVVISLITGTRAPRPREGIAAFSTPSIVHFCAALGVAAIFSAPWHVLWHAGLLLGLAGLGGMAYCVVVLRRMRRQDDYQPVLEDWFWHVIVPLAAYVALVGAALRLPGDPAPTLFLVGAATVLLLYIGIHNAWDNVTYLVVNHFQRPDVDPDDGRRVDVPAEAPAPALPDGEGAPQRRERSGSGDPPRHVASDPPAG
jgi:hypothetical protein